jgi:hypothetical protein
VRPALVAALALAMVAAICGLVAALIAGAGPLLAFVIYGLSGSVTLLVGALLVGFRREIRRRRERLARAAQAPALADHYGTTTARSG